jgi:hypothetical protein
MTKWTKSIPAPTPALVSSFHEMKHISCTPKAAALSDVQVPAHAPLAPRESVQNSFARNHQGPHDALQPVRNHSLVPNHRELRAIHGSVSGRSNRLPEPYFCCRAVPAPPFPAELPVAPFFSADRGTARGQSRSRRPRQGLRRRWRRQASRSWG